MGDSNSFGDENEGRSTPSPPTHHHHHLGHVLPVGGVEGPSSIDEENSMDTESSTVPGELIITQHSHLDGEAEDDDDELEMGEGKKSLKPETDKPQSKIKKKAGGSGRRRIEIKFIENKSRRQVTFSRRKRGLMKKAYELTTLTGTQALVLIASETGHVYTFATPKLQPVVTLREGKELIQSCLNAPDNNYPPSDFMPNAGGGGNGGGNGGGGNGGNGSGGNSPQPVPKSEPHNSPQLPHAQHGLPHQHAQHQQHGLSHPQHPQMGQQHGQHPQHNPSHHDPMLSSLYGNNPHAVGHGSPYSPHMAPSYPPHDLYLASGQQTLPPMSLGQHMPHHVDPSKGREHHLQ